MIIVFDLDDTLYDELSFVTSGFEAVSSFIKDRWDIPKQETYQYMVNRLPQGRGKIFDDMLLEFEIYSKNNVRKCISVYRGHESTISLYKEADDCLNRLKKLPIYIVTDGNKIVQKNKLVSLGLYDRVKFCYITYRYGIKNSKPSPYCFYKICAREKVNPEEVVYIGDNPGKDFVGIKPHGFRTVRVLTGQYREARKNEEYEADSNVNSLAQVDIEFLKQIVNK